MSTLLRQRVHGTMLLVAMLLLFAAAPRGRGFTGFDDFLQRHEAASSGERAALTQLFIEWQQSRGGFPIAHGNGDVVFVYAGGSDERDVRLSGDFLPIDSLRAYFGA